MSVISCGTSFPDSPALLALIAESSHIFGSRKLLALWEQTFSASRADSHPLGAASREDVEQALRLHRRGERVVILASGDALYHGIGGTLQRLAGEGDCLEFHPGVTAFQSLFHKIGQPWEDARLFSAHWGEPLPLREMAEAPLAVIYGGSRYPAHTLAAELLRYEASLAGREAVAAQELGTESELIRRGRLEELASDSFSATSLLVLLPAGEKGTSLLPLGLPEEWYERENNLITASDVRAVILARLRLPARGVLWDIGAGSGSVGLEAAALRPGLRVQAVEKSEDRAAMIARNAARMGVANHRVFTGNAALSPGVLDDLETPDRIFVGGSGRDILTVMESCFNRLRPGGLLAASAVTLETAHALYGFRPESRSGLLSLDIAVESGLAGKFHQLKAQNRITLILFTKP